MARAYQPKTQLNKLQYSPTKNPLLDPSAISSKLKRTAHGSGQQGLIPDTGETFLVNQITLVQEVDDDQFVKLFDEGIKAAFNLSQTGARVFQIVLAVYWTTSMKGGFADAIELFWHDGKVVGLQPNMSECTFNLGLRELLDKKFLDPRTPGTFWVNPALFFKGDRVRFVKEYVRKHNGETGKRRGRPPKAHAKAVQVQLVAEEPSDQHSVVPFDPAQKIRLAEAA